jgi:hypothetical protein
MAETSENKSGSTPQGELIEENSKPFQLIKYFFDVVNDDTVTYNAQITDNWIESNSAIQDHIALQPVTITMRGLCGELVYDAKQAELDYKSELAQAKKRNSQYTIIWKYGDFKGIEDVDGKLVAIGKIAPPLSNITEMAQNNWELLNIQNQKASKIVDAFKNRNNKTMAQQMNNYNGLSTNARQSRLKQVGDEFKKAILGRKSFTVNTPFGTFENMYLQTVTLHQGEEDYIGDIDITLKQIRFAQTQTTKADEKTLSELNSLAQAQADAQNNGNTQGVNKNPSAIKDAYDASEGVFFK